jgi:hypothetical protein
VIGVEKYQDIGVGGFRTIKYHMGQIIAQLHLRKRAEVIAWATRRGLVHSE